MDKTKLLNELQATLDAAEQLELDQRNLLRRLGWEYTSSFPDCCWRHVKVIEGRTLAVQQSDAISFELHDHETE